MRLVVLALVVTGCFQSKGTQDGGVESDSDLDATVDGRDATGPIGRCDAIGPIEQCYPDCRAFDDCPEETGCNSPRFLCIPVALRGGGVTAYCQDGDHYLFRGRCFPYEFCQALWRSERSNRCEYSNGEVFVDGPPRSGCPPAVDPDSPFCGPGCDACPVRDLFVLGATTNRCTGLNEDRGMGVCAMTTPCDRDNGPFKVERAEFFYETPAVCVVERVDGELADVGWIVSQATCRAYRDRYPGDFACVDPASGWQDIDD